MALVSNNLPNHLCADLDILNMRIQNLLILLLLSVYQVNVYADKDSSSDSANASATVVAPVTLVKTADLLFGSVAPASFATGTVTIDPNGGRMSANVVLSSMGLGNPASFYLTGDPGAGFSINLPSSITLTGPGNPMQLNAFTSSPTSIGTFSPSGTATINVGGTLTVGANQAAGIYLGSFSISVDYY